MQINKIRQLIGCFAKPLRKAHGENLLERSPSSSRKKPTLSTGGRQLDLFEIPAYAVLSTESKVLHEDLGI